MVPRNNVKTFAHTFPHWVCPTKRGRRSDRRLIRLLPMWLVATSVNFNAITSLLPVKQVAMEYLGANRLGIGFFLFNAGARGLD